MRLPLSLALFFSHSLFSVRALSLHDHGANELSRRHETVARAVSPQDLTLRDGLTDTGLATANWIWTAQPTTGNVAFLKTFASTKTATTAVITLTAVNHFTVFVNGNPVGQSGSGTDAWKAASVFRVNTNATSNIFSILAVNDNAAGEPAPGLVAAIKVNYADGTSDFVISDASWGVSPNIPTDFPTPANTGQFTPATVLAPFGSGVWASSVTLNVPAAPPPASILSTATWIWDSPTANILASPGFVGFRRTFASAIGKKAASASILMTADNGFDLYVNGEYIGSSPGVPVIPDFGVPVQFTSVALKEDGNVFTVIAQNILKAGDTTAGAAGLAAEITVNYGDGSSDALTTDATWLRGTFTTIAAFLAVPDAQLVPSSPLGKMGVLPWGTMKSVSNMLNALEVPQGPFAAGTVPATSTSSSQSSTATASSSTTSSSSTTRSTSTTFVTTTAQASGNAAQDATTGTAHGGLSSGAVAGIVIGIILLIAVGSGIVVWYLRHKQRQGRTRAWLSGFTAGARDEKPGGEDKFTYGTGNSARNSESIMSTPAPHTPSTGAPMMAAPPVPPPVPVPTPSPQPHGYSDYTAPYGQQYQTQQQYQQQYYPEQQQYQTPYQYPPAMAANVYASGYGGQMQQSYGAVQQGGFAGYGAGYGPGGYTTYDNRQSAYSIPLHSQADAQSIAAQSMVAPAASMSPPPPVQPTLHLVTPITDADEPQPLPPKLQRERENDAKWAAAAAATSQAGSSGTSRPLSTATAAIAYDDEDAYGGVEAGTAPASPAPVTGAMSPPPGYSLSAQGHAP